MKLKFNWFDKPQSAPEPIRPVETPILEDLILDPVERSLLSNLIRDPAFPVLVKVMNAACYEATKRLVSVDTMNREEVIARHLEARAKNEFCFRLIALIKHWAGAEASKSTRDNPTEKTDVRTVAGIHTRSSNLN